MRGKLSPVSRHAGGVFFLLRALTVGLFPGSHLSHAGTPQIQVLVQWCVVVLTISLWVCCVDCTLSDHPLAGERKRSQEGILN